ncbi:MAG: GGDEF domain-containing protein [Oscillospiraceae bacterium]|nr:GGDEF domain-containing protein [Oscillospiraceae bacterium]
MKKNRSASAVAELVGKLDGDAQEQIRELTRLVKEGQRSGDLLSVGAAYCSLAEARYAAGDLNGMLSDSLKAVALLKDTDAYELTARSYTVLGTAYTYCENDQMSLISNEVAYEIVKKHRIKGAARLKVLINLAANHQIMGDVAASIRLLNECVDLTRESSLADCTVLAKFSLNLADCYKDNGEPERAGEVLASMSAWIGSVSYKPLVCDYYLKRAIVSYLLRDIAAGDGYTDAALERIPENVYPHPVYDDLRQVAHLLSINGDRVRAERILAFMTVYSENTSGTLEQLYATRMMADFFNNFAEYERACGYYAKYEELNEKHLRELKEKQLQTHKTTRNSEAEIRRLKRKMRKNEELISLEPMTGLLNRSALLRLSSEFIASAAKNGGRVGAIFIDIDCFKECNDTYGHAEGDKIIREVARVCRRQESACVRFARYGGDEFFGMTTGMTDEGVRDIARRISRAVRDADIPNENNHNGGRITLSIGVVNLTVTDKPDALSAISNYADKALYHAKNSGRNTICELVRGDDGGISYVMIGF